MKQLVIYLQAVVESRSGAVQSSTITWSKLSRDNPMKLDSSRRWQSSRFSLHDAGDGITTAGYIVIKIRCSPLTATYLKIALPWKETIPKRVSSNARAWALWEESDIIIPT